MQMRIMIVSFCALGMFVSYMSGYALMVDELKSTRIELALKKGEIDTAYARVEELRARALDRDSIELNLRACLKSATKYVDTIEDIKWQMNMVLNTCPGRDRPPRNPRP